MKRLLAFILIVFILSGSGVSFANASWDAFVQEHEKDISGAHLSIFTSDEILYDRLLGYENKEEQVKVNDQSVFDWGSVSKLLTWISVMQLAEKGEISLEDDIRTYLPDGFLTNLRFDEPITFLDLMHHSAGFQEMLIDLFVPMDSKIPTLGDALQSHPPAQVFPPGTVTAYSNWSTSLAGYLVEVISGENFADYVIKHIFEPLEMKETAIRPDLSDQPDVLNRRRHLRSYSENGSHVEDTFFAIPLYPAGMAVGTLADFRLFDQALLEPDAPRLFESPQTARAFFETSLFFEDGTPRNSHGLWQYPFEKNVIGHGGNTASCSSHLLLDRQNGIGFVIMSNQQKEELFNYEFPKLIFGSFENSTYYSGTRTIPSSLLTSARAVFRGPFSFTSLMIQKMDESDRESFWSETQSGSIPRVQMLYTDYLKLSGVSLWARILGIFFLLGGALYGALTLLGGGLILRPLRNFRFKKRQMHTIERPWRKWNYLSSLTLVLFFVNLLILLIQLMLFQPKAHYYWQLILIAIFLVCMLALIIRFFFLKKVSESRWERIKVIVTWVFLVGVFLIGVYFQLYSFWTL
ncbi:MAG TPA: beta-lactamase family protein [Tissierellia bacterium]|nr:beta-lactamase family protein [Tissierellia bacterium]